MKRLLLLLVLVASPVIAFALDTSKALSVGVLRGLHDEQDAVADALRRELSTRGFDAFDAERTYDEAVSDGAPVADYYVEVSAANASDVEYGGVGVGTRHAGVSMGVRVARVVAELRLYDGKTMELLSTHDLARRNTAVLPTSVGVGGGVFYAYIALPFIERAQLRRVVRATGRAAAAFVAEAIAAD